MVMYIDCGKRGESPLVLCYGPDVSVRSSLFSFREKPVGKGLLSV